jgi:hypothetical protein
MKKQKLSKIKISRKVLRENGSRRPNREMKLASLVGLEPTTYCLEGSRSVQLSYRDTDFESSIADNIWQARDAWTR